MSVATVAGTCPMLNSSTAGTRYAVDGTVCMASRIGRMKRLPRSLSAAQMPSGTPITIASADRHDHQRHRLHRRFPQPDDAGERHAPGGERGRSPAPGPGDQREHDDGQREPRQPEKEVGERVERGVDAVPERLEEPREQRVREAVVLDPVLQLVDRIGEVDVQAVGEPVDESVE